MKNKNVSTLIIRGWIANGGFKREVQHPVVNEQGLSAEGC